MFSCFFFKQKTAYEMRISDWSSDVCSSDLCAIGFLEAIANQADDEVVGYEPACVHDFLGFNAQGRLCLDRSAQHVARRDLRDTESFGDVGCLSAFSGAGWAEQNQTHGSIGRAHVCTPVPNAPLVCRLLLETQK